MNLLNSGRERAAEPSPEKVLWAEVLLQAAESLQGRLMFLGEDREAIQREAAEWFNSCSQEIGSFLWVCQALDLDPQTVRQAILRRGYFNNFSPMGVSPSRFGSGGYMQTGIT
jgi:hypothetical protein